MKKKIEELHESKYYSAGAPFAFTISVNLVWGVRP